MKFSPPNPHGTPFLRVLALIVFALLIAVLSSLISYYFFSQSYNSKSTPPPYKISPTISPLGSCPPGYVYYGMPLGCITQQQAEYCRTHSCPICLTSTSKILTPAGEVDVKLVKVGTIVWTINKEGHKIEAPVLKVGSTKVPLYHQVIDLKLKDKRELLVSPGHPTINNKTVSQLKVGDKYDGSIVSNTFLVSYYGQRTYDLLPAGDTGFYYANDILMASTLSK